MLQERTELTPSEENLPLHPLVRAAYEKAKKGHEGQMRQDGTKYFEGHCDPVRRIISEEWGITEDIDPELNAAALMHDLIEDTGVSYEQLVEEFGTAVANIVEGVSKFKSEGNKTATIEERRKVLSHGYEDYRVIILKLADRLQNFRTMEGMSEESQVRKANETLEMYAPVARALGMWKAKTELEDWSFQYLMPEKYQELKQLVDSDPRRSEEAIAYAKSHLEIICTENGIPAQVEVRQNGYWALYQKSERLARTAEGSFSDINDVVSFRIITDTRRRCYDALWVVHEKPFLGGKVISRRFDEFIVEPRPNNYQAMQTTIEVNGYALEVAIATREMEDFNNYGIVDKIRRGEKNLDEYLMKSVFVVNGENDSHKVRMKLLLRNATGIDLAYAMGEQIGAQAVSLETLEGAQSLATIIKNASVVKVVTDPDKKIPQKNWGEYALPETKAIIEQQLRVYERNELISARKAELDLVLHKRGVLELSDLGSVAEHLLLDYGCQSVTELAFIVTRTPQTLKHFERALDDFGVTKEKLGWTSIHLSGSQDSPGILRDIVEWTRELGRSIIKDESRVHADGSFSINMIIKGVTPEEETLIADKLRKDNRFQKILLI